MSRSIPAADATTRPFTFARLALALVVPVIAYASLRPFHGWRDRGLGWEVFLRMPEQRAVALDAMLNFVGYLPFGLCLALALFPRLRGGRAFWLGAVVPALFSVAVELLQLFLPGRLPSMVDVAMNVLGATAGAAIAVLATPWLADHRGGRHLRARWFAAGHLTEGGLVVLAAWFVAVFAQRTLLFGTGDWRGNLQVAIDWGVRPAVYFVTEAFVVAANLVVAAIVLRLVLSEGAARRRWLAGLVALALLLRGVAQLGFWEPAAALRWITPAAVVGLAGGLVLARWAMGLPPRRAALSGMAWLLAAVGVVNLAPPDPALWQQPSPPREQMLIGLALVARYTSKAWPVAALVFLGLTVRRANGGSAAAP
jgi:VanZ family protein